MNGFNRIFILGRLGSEPQIQTSRGGHQFTKLSVATNRTQNDEDGEKKETTDWYTINAWGRQGELCARYLSKGQGVMVEGYLSTFQVAREDGKNEGKIAINALKVEFLPKPMGATVTTEIVPIETMQ